MQTSDYRAYKVKIIIIILAMLILNTTCQNTNRPVPNVQTSAETPSTTSPSSVSISFDVESVTLNYTTRKMEICGKLRNSGATKPEKVWVWAYFFAPNSEYASGSWSDSPIELNNPFASGNEVNITATGHFHWWNNSNTPKSGYYARVSTSTQSEDAAKIPPAQRIYSKTVNGTYVVRIVE